VPAEGGLDGSASERSCFQGASVSEATASLFLFLAQIEQSLGRIEQWVTRLLPNLHKQNYT